MAVQVCALGESMARVNVFLKDEVLKAVDAEAAQSGTNRSALIQSALTALHQSGRCALVIPEFSLLEILNAVRFSERAEEADASRALGFLERLRLDIVPLDWELLRKSTAIAWAYQVALYDAVYVALAERLGFPLLTADE